MPAARPVKIAGVGRYVPQRVVTTEELAERIGISARWIIKNQGVRERRWVTGETASSMAAEAAREALDRADLPLGELDLILNASGTSEKAIPDGAALLQRELGLGESGITCFSVHATCLSFLVGLELASQLVASGAHKNILLYSSDIASCALNFDHAETSSLFGDMAAAVVLCPAAPGEASCVHVARLETYGSGADLTAIHGGGTARHPNHPDTRPEDNLFHMEGRKVFRLAMQKAPGFLERLQPGLSRGLDDIALVIPHQASKLALRAQCRQFGFPEERMITILEHYGNCVAASLPGALYEAVVTDRLRRGDKAIMLGTGAGLSMGGLIFTY